MFLWRETSNNTLRTQCVFGYNRAQFIRRLIFAPTAVSDPEFRLSGDRFLQRHELLLPMTGGDQRQASTNKREAPSDSRQDLESAQVSAPSRRAQ